MSERVSWRQGKYGYPLTTGLIIAGVLLGQKKALGAAVAVVITLIVSLVVYFVADRSHHG